MIKLNLLALSQNKAIHFCYQFLYLSLLQDKRFLYYYLTAMKYIQNLEFTFKHVQLMKYTGINMKFINITTEKPV